MSKVKILGGISLLKNLFLLVLAVLLAGCLGPKVSPNAAHLTLDFEFTKKHQCSSISPEIRVGSIPVGTQKLKVKLVDLDVPNWDHGGGTIDYSGAAVIPENSLKSGYNGPCPPSGSHRYQIKVNAVDAAGVIIGQGKGSQMFP